jgi:hypothetical protein
MIAPETLAWLRHASSCGKAEAQALLHLLERMDVLEAAQQQPTPEAAPVAPVARQRLMKAPMDARGYVDLREPPAAQPTPPVAPAGGLVEMVAAAINPKYPNFYRGDARAAIREVAAWLDSNAGLPDNATPREADGWEMAAQILNRETDR